MTPTSGNRLWLRPFSRRAPPPKSAPRRPPTSGAELRCRGTRRWTRRPSGSPAVQPNPSGPKYCPPSTPGSVAARSVGSAPISASWNSGSTSLVTAPTSGGRLRVNSVRDPPGWAAAAIVLCAGEPPLQFVGEQQVGELGLAVGADPAVAGLPLQVVEADSARAKRWPTLLTVTIREPARGQQAVEQQPGEREVAEVVGAELQLEAVLGRRLRREHHAGVVDQQVDGVVRRTAAARRPRGPTSSDVRSSSWTRDLGAGSGSCAMRSAASLPLSRLRTASTTCAPLAGECGCGLVAEARCWRR